MDKGFEKEKFETLKIKRSVAIEFRKFSKMLSKSQSMTLLLMMDFFNENGIFQKEIGEVYPRVYMKEKNSLINIQ